MQPFRLNIYDATVMKPHQPIVDQFPQRRVFRKLEGQALRLEPKYTWKNIKGMNTATNRFPSTNGMV